MPDFYAHQVFGAQVFSALPEPVRRRLEPQRPGWQCGLYGLDPLFFYRLPKSSPVSREGHELHRHSRTWCWSATDGGGPEHPLCPGLCRGLSVPLHPGRRVPPHRQPLFRGQPLKHTLLEGGP